MRFVHICDRQSRCGSAGKPANAAVSAMYAGLAAVIPLRISGETGEFGRIGNVRWAVSGNPAADQRGNPYGQQILGSSSFPGWGRIVCAPISVLRTTRPGWSWVTVPMQAAPSV